MDQDIQVFVTVADKQNFSRAAEDLHMTQPAVSQSIRAFERQIGTRLLDRSNKYVRLNQAGKLVYYHAKEILGLYATMQNLVDDMVNKAEGPLSIGASYTFGEYVLPRIVAQLLKEYPAIQPSVTIGNTSEIAHLIATHQLDIGIVEGHFKEQQLKAEAVAEDEMVIVASPDHRFAKNKKVKADDLKDEMWLMREQGSGTREALENVWQQLLISPDRLMHFGSTQSIKEAIEAGMGISLLSHWAIQKELKHGDLTILDVDGLPFHRRFSLITKSMFQTKALEVFIDMLRQD